MLIIIAHLNTVLSIFILLLLRYIFDIYTTAINNNCAIITKYVFGNKIIEIIVPAKVGIINNNPNRRRTIRSKC
jgi:hypothetical protein